MSILPKVLVQMKEARDCKNAWEKEYEKLKPKAIALLKQSGNSLEGAKLIETTKINVDTKQAMTWAKENLSEKTYDTLFVEVFDQNKFIDLVRKLQKNAKRGADGKRRRILPKGIITKSTSESVRF